MDELPWKAADSASMVLSGVPASVGARWACEIAGNVPARYVGTGRSLYRLHLAYYFSDPGPVDYMDVVALGPQAMTPEVMGESVATWIFNIQDRQRQRSAMDVGSPVGDGQYLQPGPQFVCKPESTTFGRHCIFVVRAVWDVFSK